MADNTTDKIKTSSISSVDPNTSNVTMETSSSTYTTKGFWSKHIANIMARHMDMQICSSPWGITFLDKNGNIDHKAQKRWEQISKVSQWERLPSRLVKKMSLEGNASIVTNYTYNPEYGNLPVIQIAQGVPIYTKIADYISYAQVILQVTQGTIPLISTVTYTPNTIDWQAYALSTQGKQAELVSINEAKVKTGLKLHEGIIKTKYGFVPLNRFENMVGIGESESGSPDLNEFVLGLCSQLDTIQEKILDEVVNNTTFVKQVQTQTNWSNTTGQGREANKKLISEQLSSSIRLLTATNDYANGDLFDIFPMTPQIKELREEFNSIWMQVSFYFGGIPMLDRMGSYQMTNAQSHTANRNTSEYIINQKLLIIKSELRKHIVKVMKMDKIHGNSCFNSVTNIVIDININEAGKEFEMNTNPEGFLKGGWSLTNLVKQTQKLSEKEAQIQLKKANDELSKYPHLYSLYNVKQLNVKGSLDNLKLDNNKQELKGKE